MAIKNAYLLDLLQRVEKRNPNEPEFIQAVTEVFSTLEPVVEKSETKKAPKAKKTTTTSKTKKSTK